jgi:undecaprenyl-diphosphatase
MSIQELDEKILLALNSVLGENDLFDALVELVAIYTIYVIPIVLVVLWFRRVREAGIRAALAGLLTWLIVSPLIAEVWFRTRPELAELGGRELFFHRPTYSFPSDHAGFLMAVTVSFYLVGMRKITVVFLIAAIIVPLTRVVVGFHFPTDIVGGWLVGATVAWVVFRFQKPIDQYISQPLINLARMIRLA